jgi:hypothetical protein
MHSATSFGPKPSLVICPEYPPFFSSQQRYAEQTTRSTIHYNLKQLTDAWCMDSVLGSVVIGGDGKMLYSSDLSRPQGSFRTIPVGGSAIYAVKHVNKVTI